MARIRIEFNNAGLREALRSDTVTHALQQVADGIASRAKAAAPVDTGAYRDSIQTQYVDNPSWERPRVRVFSDDYKAHWIENGYDHNGRHVEGQRVLGRAADG